MSLDELTKAIYLNDLRRVEALVHGGHDVNRVDAQGRTPLMIAILSAEPSPIMVELLLKLGADPRIQDRPQQWTALHFAARDRLTRIAELLLEQGADVDAQDAFGNTPLWRAVMGKRTDMAVVQLLLRSGASPDQKNRSGISPRTLASEKDELRDLFSTGAPSDSR